jgi:hypothetical protein
MDNFDLKQYLSNNPLLENDGLYNVYKITLKDNNDTYYTKATVSQASTPQKWFQKFYNATIANAKRNVSQGEIGRLMTDHPDMDSWDLSTIKTGLTDEEATKLRDELRRGDSNSLKGRGGSSARTGTISTKIQVPSDQSKSFGGKIYVNALYLQKNPEFKKRVEKLLDKTSQNIGGSSYIGINSPNVERV